MNRPSLQGIRVLELGSSVAAPAATRLLADLGATVYKVEPPGGDAARRWGIAAPDETSWFFKSHNRNKQFLTYDLRRAEDASVVREIALRCDIVVENFRPGWLDERGLGYDDLSAENDELIYVSISGYGQSGPYRSRPGYGNVGESVGGLRYLTGEPGETPMRVGTSVGDELAALYAVVGVLASLQARERTGKGDRIDVSLTESCFSILEGVLPEYVHEGVVAEPTGSMNARIVPSGSYRTRDGRYIAVGGNGQRIFRDFAAVMGQPELADDARFIDNPARAKHVAELESIIKAWAATKTLDEALGELVAADVPAGPVASIADIVADPHFLERGAIASVPDDDGNAVATPGLVPRFSRHRSQLRHAAGSIGRDQRTALAELGIAGEDLTGSSLTTIIS